MQTQGVLLTSRHVARAVVVVAGALVIGAIRDFRNLSVIEGHIADFHQPLT
jgi:hypothetical protein